MATNRSVSFLEFGMELCYASSSATLTCLWLISFIQSDVHNIHKWWQRRIIYRIIFIGRVAFPQVTLQKNLKGELSVHIFLHDSFRELVHQEFEDTRRPAPYKYASTTGFGCSWLQTCNSRMKGRPLALFASWISCKLLAWPLNPFPLQEEGKCSSSMISFQD